MKSYMMPLVRDNSIRKTPGKMLNSTMIFAQSKTPAKMLNSTMNFGPSKTPAAKYTGAVRKPPLQTTQRFNTSAKKLLPYSRAQQQKSTQEPNFDETITLNRESVFLDPRSSHRESEFNINDSNFSLNSNISTSTTFEPKIQQVTNVQTEQPAM